jgi:sugar phosphate isomerase/epimerase
MKISIAIAPGAPEGYPAIYKKDLRENVRKAKDFGYDGLEWHLRRPDSRETEEMQKLFDSLDMQVNAVGTGMSCLYDGLTLMHPDEEVRSQAVSRLKEFVDMAQTLQSTVIIGSMKGKVPPDGDQDVYREYCAESLKGILEYAGNKNVPVVLEVLNRYETNFLNTAQQMDQFIKSIGSKLLKTHIDTFHMNIEEADLYESILRCRDTLGHIHFADSNRYRPGAGHLDFKAVMRGLKEAGYVSWIGLECHAGAEPDADAQQALEYIRSI